MWFSRFLNCLKRNCRNITLHGCINISESRTVLELVFWVLVQVLCFGLCLWLMTIHWLRYRSRPTVTTIKSTAYPISDIPFPAVTICNSNVVHKRQFEYYEKLLVKEGVNQTRIKNFFTKLNQLIHLTSINETETQFDEIENLLNNYGLNSEKLMKNLQKCAVASLFLVYPCHYLKKVMHSCSEMLENCTWSSIHYNCSQMFRPIKTGLGYCCSFNYFNDIVDFTFFAHLCEVRLKEKVQWCRNAVPGAFKEPVIAEGAGMAHGLSVYLNIGTEYYMAPILPFEACFVSSDYIMSSFDNNSETNIIVLVHPNWDFSDLATFSVAMQPGDFALMQLIPTVFTADENLRTVSVSKRNCWFENEGHLESTRNYSFTNCIVECKVRTTYEFCQCVPFYYPQTQDKRRQCTLRDVPCLKKYELLYNSIKIAGSIMGNSTVCDCFPPCEDISYDGYVNNVRSTFPFTNNDTLIYIYFDHSWCVEYNKSLNLTWDMLLASLGGIFGLCLGGSLISLIECVYYLVKSIVMGCLQGRPKSFTAPTTKVIAVQPKF